MLEISINFFQLISIDSSGKSLSNLNRLKTKRLSDIYTDLFEKMEQQRRSLIMKRVQTAEKVSFTTPVT